MSATTCKLTSFPLPPSVNAAYRNLNVPGLRGRAKTKAYRDFEHEVFHWALEHRAELEAARALCQRLRSGLCLKVRYVFWMHNLTMKNDGVKPKTPGVRQRLFGEPRANDTSNRIKVLEDVMSRMLHIDDAWFWAGSYEKFELAKAKERPSVDIEIKLQMIVRTESSGG